MLPEHPVRVLLLRANGLLLRANHLRFCAIAAAANGRSKNSVSRAGFFVGPDAKRKRPPTTGRPYIANSRMQIAPSARVSVTAKDRAYIHSYRAIGGYRIKLEDLEPIRFKLAHLSDSRQMAPRKKGNRLMNCL